MKETSVVLLCAALLAATMTSCSGSKKVTGGARAIGAGAAAGALIGKATGHTALGAIIGAAVGGTAGVLIGHKMDQQAAEMRRDLQNAKIERVGEGIRITFDSGILFQTNSAELGTPARTNIENLSKVLNKYPDTDIVIEGDTDNTGTEEYNQALSERRAKSVSNYAIQLGVAGSRISTIGLGETNPVAPNDTVDGRQLNRRVELAVFANEKLKKAAEAGTLR